MSNPVIQLQQIERTYGKNTVLSGVDLDVNQGEHILLTGPSGSGKSTILRLIAGLETPSAGQVVLSDHKANTEKGVWIPPGQRNLAMVFQDLGLWPNLTVIGNIQLGLAGQSLTRAEKKTRVEQAIKDCAISGLEKRKPGKLSAGEQQRLALARAFASEPQILLLDEPFAALDLLLREELFALINREIRRRKMTVITVSHQPSDAIGLQVDRVVVLEAGRIAEALSGSEMMSSNAKSNTLQAWKRQLRRVPESEGAVVL